MWWKKRNLGQTITRCNKCSSYFCLCISNYEIIKSFYFLMTIDNSYQLNTAFMEKRDLSEEL